MWIAIAMALGIFIGSLLNYPKSSSRLFFNTNSQEAKIKRLIDYIQYDYVDKVNTDSLLDGTIKQILSKLDPHSIYIPAAEHDAVAESMNGEFVGIGIQFRMFNDSLTVLKALNDGPSKKAGIKAGDRILMADGDTLFNKNISTDYILKTLKGEEFTPVELTVYRKGNDSLFTVTMKRDHIPVKSVNAYYMLKNGLGYIKIDKFSNNTYDEFKLALNHLQNSGLEHLVLDLRGNPGGYMDQAIAIADEFLSDGKLIVFTKNKGGRIDKSYATDEGSFEKGKVYVLIDETSASASEIIAGALQDNDKGTIVGRRSFGKGLVQQEMELGDGSAVRLTVARYYTPTGRSIQKPYKNGNENAYFHDRSARYYSGELTNKDSIKVIDSLKYTTPEGKVVYGGGGIVPDIFVGIDTTAFLGRYHVNMLNDFAFEYIDKHREELSLWNPTEFMQNFDADNKIFKAYLSNFDNTSKIVPESIPYIKIYLKALFARYLFDDNLFYEIINQKDAMIEKVLLLDKD